ncbi:ectoine hydroxylase [Microbulbifer sp. OS29]|uniref:Ectoine hydroxylase n=1 Tax=Microbulbifer okhotskensis TaxID=2926617 RepID=A0A9X2EMN7_9GAMM|nr:ectoine hydroxylase [Microbulbifer okhotskensis]MCO1335074.1 ectoine hydroxylase [Microbulbifer okhotskensis]
MKPLPKSQHPARNDLYPSRKWGVAGQVRLRKDPVIYEGSNAPPSLELTQMDTYKKQGFIVLDDLFSEQEVHLFKSELDALKQSKSICKSGEVITEPDSNEVRSVFRIHENSRLFSKLSRDKRLSSIARYILGDKVYIHQSRANYKPGFRGKDFYWHSDFETWHVEDGMPRMRALSVSITLTENHHYNGPLMLIPKSHHHFIACDGETPKGHYLRSLKKQELGVPSDNHLRALVSRGGISAITSKPGSIVMFDCNVMHGSSSNISPYPRSNLFFVFNALSNKVEDPFCNLPPRPEYICTRRAISGI